jgi:hypothetical protein
MIEGVCTLCRALIALVCCNLHTTHGIVPIIKFGSTIGVSNNNIYNNATNFNITVGGAVLSAGNNRTTPGGITNPSGTIPLQ